MSAAEVLTQHQINQWAQHDGWWGCTCDGDVKCDGQHQLDALKAAGYAVVELPTVAHKGPHDTDAKFFRQVADRMETPSRVDFLSGSNVRDAVRALLYRAADAAEAQS